MHCINQQSTPKAFIFSFELHVRPGPDGETKQINVDAAQIFFLIQQTVHNILYMCVNSTGIINYIPNVTPSVI